MRSSWAALKPALQPLATELGDTMHLSDASELERTLHLQKAACMAEPYPTAQRRADLLALKTFVKENQSAIVQAISADYGHRSEHETLFAEIVPVIHAVEHALQHVHTWMQPEKRHADWWHFWGTRNRVVPQPLGVVGVIVPWNFPINLSFMVLVDAFAAGNRAMVKLSENSRHLAKLLISKAPQYFAHDKLAFFDETGGVGPAFSQLKFDHLVFTGSAQTARAVMAAAAHNLCPVTLELGGKSPAVVCEDFDLKLAAERIWFAKCFNAGQLCTNVDHVFVPQHEVKNFVALSKQIVQKRFASLASPDLTAIIDARAFERLTAALQEAAAQGAQVIPLLEGPAWDAEQRKIAPHLVLNVPHDCALFKREIFGPVLPVYGYQQLEDVVYAASRQPTPLAFYIFSHDAHMQRKLLTEVKSGGVSVNDVIYHAAQHDLPFGGVGESGMGRYHGHDGFKQFSHLRPVFYQARMSGMRWMWPPYGAFAKRYMAWLLKK
jgi:coniferyl-aldehyde dehydrogenase